MKIIKTPHIKTNMALNTYRYSQAITLALVYQHM